MGAICISGVFSDPFAGVRSTPRTERNTPLMQIAALRLGVGREHYGLGHLPERQSLVHRELL